MVSACNFSTWEVKAGASVPGYSLFHSKLETCLGYIRPWDPASKQRSLWLRTENKPERDRAGRCQCCGGMCQGGGNVQKEWRSGGQTFELALDWTQHQEGSRTHWCHRMDAAAAVGEGQVWTCRTELHRSLELHSSKAYLEQVWAQSSGSYGSLPGIPLLIILTSDLWTLTHQCLS